MKKESGGSLFRRLTRLFKSGPKLRKKISTSDTAIAVPDNSKSSGALLFQKSLSPTYATITSNAYNMSERLMRYQDFNEMQYTPELASALDIYADETVPQDEKGKILHIYSDNEKIKELLEDLFYNIVNVDFNLRPWVRNLVKYGDFFLYNDIHPEYGVMNVFPIPVNELEREENYDPQDPFAVRFRWVTLGNRTLENWEVSHFRLLGDDMFLPYGSSVLEPARRIWRQLILIEDAMLVYRVVRAPDRRVFYIDVGNLPPDEVEAYIEKQKQQLKTNQVIDKQTGRIDLRYNPLSIEEDYYIPVRGSESGTKIDTLAGGTNAAAIEDVEYIQKKMIGALKVPRAYLGYDDMLTSKATLAQEDIRFARTVNVIQKTVTSELSKLAIVHLYSHGFSGDDLLDFQLRLTNPSTIAEQQKLELWRARFEIAGSSPEGMLHPRWIQKNILNMTNNEIQENKEYMESDDSTSEGGGGGSGGGGGGGGGSLFGGGGGAAPGGDDMGGDDAAAGGDLGDLGDLGADADAPATDEDKPDDLEAGIEDESDRLLTSGEDQKKGKLPVKTNPTPLQKSNHRRYVRRERHGNANIHMPDFHKMVKPNDDVYDVEFMKTQRKNSIITPISVEGVKRQTMASRSPDIVALLMKMSENGFGSQAKKDRKGRTVIKESVDVQQSVDDGNYELDIEISEE